MDKARVRFWNELREGEREAEARSRTPFGAVNPRRTTRR
jgi:hypothetical protein